jgi:hypothetical protein
MPSSKPNRGGCTVTIQATLFEIEHLHALEISHHVGIDDSGSLSDCGGNVIRNMEQQRCGDTQLPETFAGRHPEDFPPPVLPSAADLDTYVAMVADEEKIRVLTSNARVANRPGRLNAPDREMVPQIVTAVRALIRKKSET